MDVNMITDYVREISECSVHFHLQEKTFASGDVTCRLLLCLLFNSKCLEIFDYVMLYFIKSSYIC